MGQRPEEMMEVFAFHPAGAYTSLASDRTVYVTDALAVVATRSWYSWTCTPQA